MTEHGSDGDELLPSPPVGRRRWWYLLAAAVLGTAIVSFVVRHSHDAPRAATTPSPPSTSTSTSALVPPPEVHVIDAIHGLTGSLYVRTSQAVLRFDFSRAHVVTTPLPRLASSGPVSFVVTRRGALVRPDDAVPGYLVPSDDTAAQPLQGALSSTAVLPGPRPDRFWMSRPGSRVMVLADLTGHTVGRVALPVGSNPPMPDGSGYLLASTQTELLDVRPARTVAVTGVGRTDDVVVATGANRILLRRCARPLRPSETCAGVLESMTSRRTRQVGTLAAPRQRGVIAPGAGTALVYRAAGPDGEATVAQLIELPSGRPRGGAIAVDATAQPDAVAASSDGRWVLLIARDDTLVAIDTTTGRTHRIATVAGALQLAFGGPVG